MPLSICKKTFKAFGSRRTLAPLAVLVCAFVCPAHVTIQTDRPLQPHTTVRINIVVPNESDTDTTQVSLEVPDAFLSAGGRLSRVDFPAGWQVNIEKEDQATTAAPADPVHDARESSRRARIKKVTFSGGAIPPDGYKIFNVELQLPDQPGQFRFPAVQTYTGGKVISWSELVPDAAHPAPTLNIQQPVASASLISENLPLLLSAAALALAVISLFMGSRRRVSTPTVG